MLHADIKEGRGVSCRYKGGKWGCRDKGRKWGYRYKGGKGVPNIKEVRRVYQTEK